MVYLYLFVLLRCKIAGKQKYNQKRKGKCSANNNINYSDGNDGPILYVWDIGSFAHPEPRRPFNIIPIHINNKKKTARRPRANNVGCPRAKKTSKRPAVKTNKKKRAYNKKKKVSAKPDKRRGKQATYTDQDMTDAIKMYYR